MVQQEAILRFPQVRARTGLSRSTLYLYINRGDFPKPISLGSRAVGFIQSEIDAWIESRIKAAKSGGAA